jgi:hypothetical protein
MYGGVLRGYEVEEGGPRGKLAEDRVAVHRVQVLLVLRARRSAVAAADGTKSSDEPVHENRL